MREAKKPQKSKEKEKPEKAIERLEQIDEEERTVQDDFALALAYLESAKGKWSEKDKIGTALGLLLSVRGIIEAKIGEGFFDLDQWSLALPFLERARDHSETLTDEENDHIDTLVEDCDDLLTFPKFKESFKKRVQKVWKDFSINTQQLEKDLDDQEVDDKGAKALRVNEIFNQAIIYDTSCWLLKTGDKLEISPYPGDSLLRCIEWQYVKEQAPAEVLKDWKFVIGDPPSTDQFLGVYLKGKNGKAVKPDFDINTISLWVSGEKDEGFSVTGYCKDWEPFLDFPDVFEDEEEVVSVAVREFLGTIVYDKYIDVVSVAENPLPEKPIKVVDLPKFFADKGIDIHAPADEILNTMISYEEVPDEELEDLDPREDITSGKTMCMKLVDEYKLDETDAIDEIEPDGVSAGFLYYSVDCFKGKSAKKNRDQFMESLKKELNEKAGKESVKIIGEATGTTYDYVDFLAWDLDKVLDVASNFFEKAPVSKSAFHVFRKNSGSIVFTGMEDTEDDTEDEEKDSDN